MSSNNGFLVVISGPSGAGKGTICKEVKDKNKDIFYSISATTRQKRENEEEGKNYYFISKEKFEEKILNNDFLEWAKVYDNYYGTLKAPVVEQINKGRIVFLEIDIQGAMEIKKVWNDAIYVFIFPPTLKELKSRIIKRGTETLESIHERMDWATSEVKYYKKYDYIIINDDLDKAVKKFESIIMAEKCKVIRNNYILDNI